MLHSTTRNEQWHTLVIVGVGMLSQGFLDALNLLWNGRQHALLQPVELIKTAPCTHLAKSYKDASHCLHTDKKIHWSSTILLAYAYTTGMDNSTLDRAPNARRNTYTSHTLCKSCKKFLTDFQIFAAFCYYSTMVYSQNSRSISTARCFACWCC